MRKKALLLTLLIGSMFASASAIDNSPKGIEFYKFEAMEPAKIILLNSFKQNEGNKAEVSYYLGEIYFTEGNRDSAGYYFNAGLTANPDFVLNEVGLAKLQFKGNPAAAEASLKKIANKNKKKAEVLVAVAKAYFQNEMNAKALEYTAMAKKANVKYPSIYVLEGDIHAANKDYGKADSAYDQALYFDPNTKEAYVRRAYIYSAINPKRSIEILEKLVALDPQSPLAQRAVADAYYSASLYAKAVSAYSKYAESEYSSPADLSKYVSILFFSGNYEKASEVVLSALKKQPDNFVMNRILMYTLFEQKKYAEGLKIAEKFMNLKGNFIYNDFVYYGRLLLKNNKMDEALAQFEKARETDPSKVTINKDIAELHEAIGTDFLAKSKAEKNVKLASEHLNNALSAFDKAIAHYETFIKEGGDQVKLTDHFTVGRTLYIVGTAITTTDKALQTRKSGYLTKADKFFAYIAENSPNSYLGNLWRARANAALDPESTQGLAKPYYEAALALLEGTGKNTRELVEAYGYLGYYYLIKNDRTTSKSYWNKILEVDPNNENAKTALKNI